MKPHPNLSIMMSVYPYNSHNLVHILYGFDFGFFRPNIIALTGPKSSHNTRECITKHLVKQYSYTRLDFNDPVKIIMKELFNYSDQQMSSEKLDWKHNITPKQAFEFISSNVMQYKIQELIPECDRRFLAQHLVARMQSMQTLAAMKRFVISDLQYYHEYEEIARYDPFIIRVEGNDKNNKDDEYNTIPYNIKLLDSDSTDEKQIVRKLNHEFQKMNE
jgi:hypothetical protein